MISYKELHIQGLQDYDLLHKELEILRPNANHLHLIKELKDRIGLKCKKIVIEQPYRDADFSSVHTLFYSKKHFYVERDCIRLLFLADEELESIFGVISVRDSTTDSRGRAAFKPKYLLQVNNAFILQSPHKLNLFGEEFKINSFPWMAQDTDVDVCAHIAVWSVVNYYSQKRANYASKTIGKIVEQTPNSLGRKTPSTGLNLQQISDILQENSFYPLIISRDQLGQQMFSQALYSYVESGIPVIAALTKKAHAIVVTGHEAANLDRLNQHTGIVTPDELISNWIVSDDNHLPFQAVGTKGRYQQQDIDYLVVPLAEKMYLNANAVVERVKNLLHSNTLSIPKNSVLRVYLTSSKALKRVASKNYAENKRLTYVTLSLPMPQFVWCADIASYEEYKNDLTSARIIIDSTAGTYETEPWLLMHDKNELKYLDEKRNTYLESTKIKPYKLYTNNLIEVDKL